MPRTPHQAGAFLIGLWIAFCLSPLTVKVATADGRATQGTAELEVALLEQVNAVRASHHLIPLRRAAELDRVAKAHSLDMVRRNYLSHHDPEGGSPVDRVSRGGLEGFTLVAENLGMTDHPDPNAEIVSRWLQSPDHRRNLLAPPFNHTGIGIARGRNGSLVYTQVYVTIPR